MPGERDLDALLATMQPSLADERYVFLTAADDSLTPGSARPVMTFREREGTTWIVTEAEAARLGRSGSYPCRMITLNVHSALEAVGFLAAITAALAKRGISANAVSAFHHDHLFVSADQAPEALRVLTDLSAQAQRSV
jgi:uncharacterized protein